MTALELQLLGWRLTTAEILYRLPDHPRLLQSYIWQELDKAPEFPALHQFLDFWQQRLDGRLYSVKVAACELLNPGEVRLACDIGRLH